MYSQFKRILAAVVLVTFGSGCASYRPASLPLAGSDEGRAANRDVVEVGQNVRVTLLTGEHIDGTVVTVTDVGLCVAETNALGYTKHTIAASEIDRIDIQGWSTRSRVAVYSAAGLFTVGAVVLALDIAENNWLFRRIE